MQLKALTLLGLSAVALAAPDKVRRQDNSDLSALASLAGVTSLPTDPAVLSSLENVAESLTALLPPSSILSVLETAVPASVITELSDPAKASSFASAFDAGSTPGWYSSLPADVKSYLSAYNAGAVVTSVASGVSSATAAVSSVVGSVESAASSVASAASAASTAGSASSASPTGAAPRATGVVAAGLAGAVGVLGLAIML